jgi:hypothetical protein
MDRQERFQSVGMRAGKKWQPWQKGSGKPVCPGNFAGRQAGPAPPAGVQQCSLLQAQTFLVLLPSVTVMHLPLPQLPSSQQADDCGRLLGATHAPRPSFAEVHQVAPAAWKTTVDAMLCGKASGTLVESCSRWLAAERRQDKTQHWQHVSSVRHCQARARQARHW